MRELVYKTASGAKLFFNPCIQKYESSNWAAVNAALDVDLHNIKDPIGVINALYMKQRIHLFGVSNLS